MKNSLILTVSIFICLLTGPAFAAEIAQLSLVKVVVGGDATAVDWVLSADGTGVNDVSGAGDVSEPVLVPDTFLLSESDGLPGYVAGDWDCSGGTLVGQELTLSSTEAVTCTIVNTYEPPVVIFDSDFALPSMPDGDGSGTPVCVDDASGLLVAGCDGARPLNGLSCGEGEHLTGFTPEGDLICTFVSKCRPIGCDDQSICTTDECNEAIGLCVNDPTPHEGDPCDDGDLCTIGEVCTAGTCSAGLPVDCDDQNTCTLDICDPTSGLCLHDAEPLNGEPCDDGDFCTVGEVCTAGTCFPGLPVDCNDQNACTLDLCDSTSGMCVHDAEPLNGAPCDDGDLCTVGETCGSGVCASGSPLICDDGNVCTADLCDAGTGMCVNEAIAGPICDDGNFCTVDDQCGLFSPGVCSGIPIDCDDGNSCTYDACNGGACENGWEPFGTPCYDFPEIEGEYCNGEGVCVAP